MPKQFINFNGSIKPATALIVTGSNRAFRYGDGVFETMKYAEGRILFLKDHFQRLQIGMKLLGMKQPKSFSVSFLEKSVRSLCKKNKLSDARIRLQVYRNDGGLYAPLTNESSFILESSALKNSIYHLNSKGLKQDLFKDFQRAKNSLSNIKSCNSLTSVMAALFCKKNNLDDCIILNTDGNVSEATSSNIFAVKDGFCYTPPLTDACVDGRMRKYILQVLKKNNICFEEKTISPKFLFDADEIFLTNVIDGIKWVGSLRRKKFKNNFAEKLIDLLNNQISKDYLN